MNSPELLIAIGTLATSALAVWVGFINGRRIQDVHVSLNSRLSQLVAKAEAAAKLLGAADERERADLERKLLETQKDPPPE